MIPPESTAGPLNPETGTQMPSNPVPIAIVGIGKIARDQHIPTIAADPNFRLAAVVTRNHPIESVPAFAPITDMATATPEEIRSGSCRERVWRAVEVSGAAVYFTNKQSKIKEKKQQ